MDYLATGAVHIGDVRQLAGRLEPASVQTIVTSPPYFGLRSYLPADHPDKAHELGSEATPEQFIANLVAVFRALWPALKDDGTLWLNLGDSYWTKPIGKGSTHDPKWGQARDRSEGNAGGRIATIGQHKNLIGIPWRVAFALQADGWILRSDIVWHKPAPMPESVTDRPTRAHEFIFLLSKSTRYFYDAAAIAEPCVAGDRGSTYTDGKTGAAQTNRGQGRRTDKQAASELRTYAGFNDRWDATPTATRNKRDVWTVASAQFPGSHFATFPVDLIRPCVLAGTSARGECSACGRAWVRCVERETRPNRSDNNGKHDGTYYRTVSGGVWNDARARHSLGWAAQCSCNAPTRPQTVCDPFMGSGTVAEVAHEAGRAWVGFDLDERAIGWTHDRLRGLPVGRLGGM